MISKSNKKKLLVLFFAFILFPFALKSFACTTFIISGKHTVDGRPLLFKNRDTDQKQNSLVYFNDGRYKYIGLVDGTAEWNKMVWGGYNEAGFAIMNSAAYNNNTGDTSKLKDQEGVIMKLALQTCATLKDFEKLLGSLPKPMGLDANFGVIDAFGGAAYYETGNFNFTKFDANDTTLAPNGILIRTNHSTRADLTRGYGFVRYKTALGVLSAAAANKISPQFLFKNISRNLTNSLTKTDLWTGIPKEKDVPEFRFFIDYIPRESTASAILIVGAKDRDHVKDAMMWTILGFPLVSVAIPTWITGGSNLPKAVTMNEKFQSPICTAALKLKEECFPITYDRGWNYINLSAVINQQHNGYMQLLQPVEKEIFEKAGALSAGLKNGSKTDKDIRSFYSWVDQYLSEQYKARLNMNLFELLLKDNFTILGKVQGFKDGSMLYLKNIEEDRDVDSSVISSGAFSFHGHVPEPMQYVIHTDPALPGPYKDKYLYVTDTVISIEGTYNDFWYSTVSGGIIQKQKNELVKVIYQTRRANDSIEVMMDSTARDDTVTIKRLIHMRSSIENTEMENVKTFIRQHPGYLVSADWLACYASSWGRKQTAELYSLLTPDMKKTKYGQRIQNYLSYFRDFKVGDTIPDFALPDEYGRLTSLYSSKSKFILLDFWFAGCGPCRQYNRQLAKYYTGLHSKGLTVFSVSFDKNKDIWKEVSAGCGICWPNVRDSEGENGKLATTFGLHKYPTSYLLSKNGVILAIDIDFDQLKEKIYKQ